MKKLIVLLLLLLVGSVFGQGGAPVPFRKKPTSVVFNKDGDSTDVTTALRTALAEATTSRATLVLDSGVYLVTDSIVVSNCELVGYNAKLSFVLSGQKKAVVMGDNSAIKGFTIELDSTSAVTGDGSYGSAVCVGQYDSGTGYSNISISDLTIKHYGRDDADGIFVTGRSFNIDIKNIHFTKSSVLGRALAIHWGNALSADTAADTGHTWHPHNIRISNIAIDSMTRTASVTNGVHLSGVYDISVDNVKMQFAERAITVTPGDYGYRYAFQPDLDTSLIEGQGIVFNRVFADSLTGIGVNITGDASAKLPGGLTADQSSWFMPVHVNNSTFKGDGTADGVAVDNCRDVVFEGCTFDGFYTGIGTGANVQRLKVLGCTIVRNQYHGIQLSDGSSGPVDALIQNCYIADNDKANTDRSQIEISAGATRSVIDNNRLGLSSGEGGFAGIELLSTGSESRITNNYVYGASSVAYNLAGDSTDIVEWRNNKAAAAMTWFGGSSTALRAAMKLETVVDDTSMFVGIAVDGGAPADNEIMKYDVASGKWIFEPDVGATGGEANTLNDTGTFDGVTGFGWSQTKAAAELRIRGVVAGANITIDTAGDTALSIAASGGAGLWDTASNGDTVYYASAHSDTIMFILDSSSVVDSVIIRVAGAHPAFLRFVNDIYTNGVVQVDNGGTFIVKHGGAITFTDDASARVTSLSGVGLAINTGDSTLYVIPSELTNSWDSTHIIAGGINISDLAQNGAATNEGFYWDGTAWAVGAGVADSARLLNQGLFGSVASTVSGKIAWSTDSNLITVGTGGGDPQVKVFYPGVHTIDSFFVAESLATSTGWKKLGDTIFIDTTGGSGGGGTTDTIGFVFGGATKYQVNKALKIALGNGIGFTTPTDSGTSVDTSTISADTSVVATVGHAQNYADTTIGDSLTNHRAEADPHTVYGLLGSAETITGNWVNTTNPWADNEIATSGNWNTAYGWGDHSAQGYINTLVGLWGFLHPDYFDTTTALVTDSLFVKFSDSALGAQRATTDAAGNTISTYYLPLSGGQMTGNITMLGAQTVDGKDVSTLTDIGQTVETGEITDGTILEADLNATNAPTDNYVLSYNLGALNFTWVPDASGLGGDSAKVLLSNRVDTSTGGLVFNGGNITMSGTETVDGVDISAHAANASAHHTATVEVNDLETTAPTSVLVNELYIGTGTGTGAFSAMSGDITMNSTGVTTIGTGKVGSTQIADGSVSLPNDLSSFTEAEFTSKMSDASFMFTNNTLGDVTLVGGAASIGANKVDSSNVTDGSLSEDDVNWRYEYVPFNVVFGRGPGVTDSVVVQLPRYQSGIVLAHDSTNQGSDVDFFWIGGTVPFDPTASDSIAFTYKGDGTGVIDSLILWGPNRTNSTNVADSIWYSVDVNLSASTWTRVAYYINEGDVFEAGDNFVLKFRTTLNTDEDWIQVAWVQMRCRR